MWQVATTQWNVTCIYACASDYFCTLSSHTHARTHARTHALYHTQSSNKNKKLSFKIKYNRKNNNNNNNITDAQNLKLVYFHLYSHKNVHQKKSLVKFKDPKKRRQKLQQGHNETLPQHQYNYNIDAVNYNITVTAYNINTTTTLMQWTTTSL